MTPTAEDKGRIPVLLRAWLVVGEAIQFKVYSENVALVCPGPFQGPCMLVAVLLDGAAVCTLSLQSAEHGNGCAWLPCDCVGYFQHIAFCLD